MCDEEEGNQKTGRSDQKYTGNFLVRIPDETLMDTFAIFWRSSLFCISVKILSYSIWPRDARCFVLLFLGMIGHLHFLRVILKHLNDTL